MFDFLGLVSGQMLSDAADLTQYQIKKHAKQIELVKNIDDYNQRFIKEHDLAMDQFNTNMEIIIEKRDRLISLAKDCLNRCNISIDSRRKDEFIDFGCNEIEDDSIVVKRYLDGFYSLVYQNTVKNIPDDYKALVTYLSDLMTDKNKKLDEENKELNTTLENLIKRLEELEGNGKQSADFSSYYKNIKEKFTSNKKDVYKNLVGSNSDEESYIDAYIKVESKDVSVFSFLDKWVSTTEDGTILIFGEPGHGKSLLCDKASVDFNEGRFLKGKVSNVLAVSLNTGQNRKIINDKEVDIEKALTWKAKKKETYRFEHCQGALLFMDGFDEFIDEAKHADTNIKNIYDFMEYVNDFAANHGIHIVVLSRKTAIKNDLEALNGSYSYYELSPISEEQQISWLKKHKEYDGYRKDFDKLRNNKDMRGLLGVPLLFRLIVHNRFKTASSNIVELYNNLFTVLLKKRHITDESEIQFIEEKLRDLAYRVYCTDTDTAVFNSINIDENWIYAFYVCAYNGKKLGFFHRTFYQYFLAKYVYTEIVNLTDEKVEKFIGKLAERELDETVRQYLQMLLDKEKEKTVHINLGKMVDSLSKTEAYLNLKPRFESGDADKSKILRSQNIYRNILHIAEAFSYLISIPFKDKLDILVRKFRSEGIVLIYNENKGADLTEACLAGAYLRSATFTRANMEKADLRGADLREAHLNQTILTKAILQEANLRGAVAEKANLREADLRRACLSGTHMKGSDLTKTNLRDANLRRANLAGAIMTEASLEKAYMTFAYLAGANLSGAYMREADLREADLSGACLAGANLKDADLRGACLCGADLTGATLTLNSVNRMNLNSAKIDEMYKEIIDPSSKGYNSIEWISKGGQSTEKSAET